MRQNGLLRWLAFLLALFGLAAGMLLALSLSARARGTSTARVTARDAETGVAGAPLTAATNETKSSRREPTRR